MEEDPELQFVHRRIYLPEAHRPGEAVGSDDAPSNSRRFRIGDIIRPLYRLAHLSAYRCGEICQVVEVDEDGDPFVAYFQPSGELSEDSSVRYAEHFVNVCTTEIFDEYPRTPHSTWATVLNANY